MKDRDASLKNALTSAPGVGFTRKVIIWWLPILYLLISDSFYLRTYDSAQVKITLVQMGGIALLALWGCLLTLEGKKAFKRDDFIFLAPFLAYLAYNIISFLHTPYTGPSVDDFVRYIFYMTAALIVIREFDEPAVNRLTKILIITAYITIGYGFIQWLDINFFPTKNIGPGIDPFIWRGAFGVRVFSTFGNPNFFGNFLVLISPILVAQYLKTRSLYLIPLIGLNIWTLYFTYTKGAWLGFGMTSFIFLSMYAFFFMKKRVGWKFITGASLVPLVCAALVTYQLVWGGSQSVIFRVMTWLSTWEMIESHPLVGSGTGSFKVIYPAFRRPKIFHIEGKHNTETDHAENEFLEQWMDHGILGFGIFLWLIAFTTMVGLRGLRELTTNLAQRGARPPPRAYDLIGYLAAFLGMLSHNFFDVSMRFVSSGIYLGLLSGLVINLSRGHALWELHIKETPPAARPAMTADTKKMHLALLTPLWVLRAAALAGLIYLVYLILSQFTELQGPLGRIVQGGETLQWWIAWSILVAVVVGLGISFARIVFAEKSFLVCLIVLFMLWPVYYFWGFFKADVYHNMAIFFSKQSKWNEALHFYRQVNKYNPYFIMPYYFTGNVFNDRFNMTKQYRPEWGDTDDVKHTDYERAMGAYEKVRNIAPNYVQMHHQVGLLYMKMADHYRKQGKPDVMREYQDKALARFNLYHNLDPVFTLNYYRKAQVHISRGEFDKAKAEYVAYINAEECYVKDHKHETPEVYTNLANLEHMTGKFAEAETHYKKALELNPNYSSAKKNLQSLYQKWRRPAKPNMLQMKPAGKRRE